MSDEEKLKIAKEIQNSGPSVKSVGQEIFKIGEGIEKEIFFLLDGKGKPYNYQYKGEEFVKELKKLKNVLERQIRYIEEKVKRL